MTRDIDEHEDQEGCSRRDFIKTSALVVGGATALNACSKNSEEVAATGSSELPRGEGLPIKAAGYRYNRLEALFDGRVNIQSCNAQFETGKIGDMNTDVFSGSQTLDVTEIGLHPFMLAYANDDFRAYTLLPIFPLRLYRHKSIFIRTDRGINKPEDLRGKRIATPGYSSTSLTWIRGLLQDEYSISPRDVQWIIAAGDSSANLSGQVSEQENVLPDGVSFTQGTAGKDESDLLESAEVDALFHAIEPRAFVQGHPEVARLFPDSRSVERAYFAKTGIFPIMHAVAVRKELLEQNPWLAEAVFNAYSEAKSLAYQDMAKMGWVNDMLPWYGQELDETRTLMGKNFYSYGIEGNRKTLESLFRYSHEQGLSRRELTIEELFAPQSLKLSEA